MGKKRNPLLYAILQQQYKEVRVRNEGEPYKYKVTELSGGRCKINRISSGEEYSVCCPVCGDKRFRLNINHTFGTRIEGILMNHTAHCFNEECSVRGILESLIAGESIEIEASTESNEAISLGAVAIQCRDEHLKLDGLERIDKLVEEHPAYCYLVQRGFNPKVLGEKYGVCWCTDNKHRFAAYRIILPVFYKDTDSYYPIGWQARVIPGVTSEDRNKYWTSPKYRKSFFLPGMEWAREFPWVAVTEGMIDAYTLGQPSVSLLGKDMSSNQLALLSGIWGHSKGPVVLFGDPGFEKEWNKIREKVANEMGEDRTVLVIPDKDANSLGREKARRLIYEACRLQNTNTPVWGPWEECRPLASEVGVA